MSFFDSKEEIINIELTQHGKHLISKGKFQPAYYAFFDDDVLYDSGFLNISESQNAAQRRILDETPILKPMYSFTSVETTAKDYMEVIKKEDAQTLKAYEDILSRFDFMEFSSVQPLGKSSYNSEFYPAWQVNLMSGAIDNTRQYYQQEYFSTTNGSTTYQQFIKIPQLNFNSCSYEIFSKEKIDDVSQKEEILAEVFFDKGSSAYLTAIKDKTINIIDIIENNVDDIGKNFEAEVFIEDELQLPNGTKKKIWKRLYFFKKPTNIKNNILLDDYIYKETSYAVPDETNVEYYFQFLADNEIDLPINMKSDNAIYDTIKQDKPFGDNC